MLKSVINASKKFDKFLGFLAHFIANGAKVTPRKWVVLRELHIHVIWPTRKTTDIASNPSFLKL